MHLKMSSAIWRPFCLGLNVLRLGGKLALIRRQAIISTNNALGADSIKRYHLTSIGTPIVEIRRSYDRLISTMGFPILVRWHLYIESGLWCADAYRHQSAKMRVVIEVVENLVFLLSMAGSSYRHLMLSNRHFLLWQQASSWTQVCVGPSV